MKAFNFLFLLLISCFVWAIDPQKVIEDWQSCQMFSTLDEECLNLREQAIVIRDNVEDLQQNPQAYGFKIMSIQYNKSLQKNPKEIYRMDQELQTMLAIVGWLESPK